MIAISVIEDRFRTIQENQSLFANVFNGSSKDTRTVRRPVRGITLKEDSFATLRVVTGDGKHILLTDAGGKKGSQSHRQTQVYSNFLLQQVGEERMEKQQILETFGEPYIFLFGERARVMTFAGVLLNTFDFNWEAEWWENYEKYLRGTRCIENDARVFLSFDQTLVSGYIIGASSSKNTQEPNHVNFQFTMFLTGYTNFSDIGNGTAVPLRSRERAQKINGLRTDEAQAIVDAEFTVQGPKELQSGQVITGRVVDGKVQPQSLVEGLTAGISTVVNTWNRAQVVVNSAARQLSNLAKGDILRVPFGFAGAMAYDAVDVVRDPIVTSYGVVKYGEFNENTDEYIGSSSHYGGSTITNLLSSEQTLQSATRNQELVDKAREAWASAGFEMPSDAEAEVASFIIRNGVGLIPVGNTAVWQAAEVANTGLSVLNVTPQTAARAVSPVPIPG
jgi:hypothetical protein